MLVDGPRVTGADPAVAELLCRIVGLIPVAEHHDRIVAPDDDLARHPGRNLRAIDREALRNPSSAPDSEVGTPECLSLNTSSEPVVALNKKDEQNLDCWQRAEGTAQPPMRSGRQNNLIP